MTVIEKKQLLMAKIDAFSEDQLDKALDFLENLESKDQDRQARFEELLNYTNQKYAKVWEALA
jgi:hypothetical protein